MKKAIRKMMCGLLAAAMALTAVPAMKAEAASYKPVYVTDKNGTTCTGDFDKLTSGNIIFYPAELETSQETYPVVVWANGTMCAPALYYNLLSQIAQGGYIVVTNTDMMAADGTSQVASVDYILEKNEDADSVFYHHVDTEHIGAAGHSQGGRSAVNAAVLDSRIDCVFSIAGSNYASEAAKLSTPTFFATGTADTIVMSAMWVKPAYKKCTGTAVYASVKGGIHTTCCLNPDVYSDYAIRWFDAYLKDDAEALAIFAPGGALSADKSWTNYQSKGF